ncbi:hypothetical protein [Paraburkholderia youngii]|uniref:hypothetical protein n=1 Tax=Paraburkholderia youngii TaxID=2782701 RepID=UPI003D2313F6
MESDDNGDNFYEDADSWVVRIETWPWADRRHNAELAIGKTDPDGADDATVKFETGTAEEIERLLIERASFTPSDAKEIARVAGLTDEDSYGDEPQYLRSRLVTGVAVASFDADLVRGLRLNTVDKWLEYP